jgi:hypothetical protein
MKGLSLAVRVLLSESVLMNLLERYPQVEQLSIMNLRYGQTCSMIVRPYLHWELLVREHDLSATVICRPDIDPDLARPQDLLMLRGIVAHRWLQLREQTVLRVSAINH